MPLGLDNIDTVDYGMLHFFMLGQTIIYMVNCPMYILLLVHVCLSSSICVSVLTMLSPERHLLYIKNSVNELFW